MKVKKFLGKNKMKKRNYDDSKIKAEEMLRSEMQFTKIEENISIIDDDCIKGNGFWIFFINKNINIHEHDWFARQFCACVIGEYGGVRYMRDLRNNPTELQKALDGLAISYGVDKRE
ncbi:Hemolysin [Granulibacter bethesdensis]|nr:Hemolysin [Granulibacter bethesdensis]